MNRTAPRQQHPNHRSGFSLLELLAAIVIIAILISLLFPAFNAVRRSALVAQVSADISQLEQAIASFKSLYGVEPPSSLTIPTTEAGWSAEDRSKVMSIWREFDFATCGGRRNADGTVGYPATAIQMSGAECLVFFLGGVDGDPTDSTVSLAGFAKSPSSPWASASANNPATPPALPPLSSNRDTTGYTFDGRLVDVDGDGAPEAVDPIANQKTPYAYFSSQGKTYQKVNNATTADDFDIFGTPTNTRDFTSIYLQADGKTPHRQSGFQIISPGFDGEFGVGGVYTNNGAELNTGDRTKERDNVTNFSAGLLQK